MPYFNYSVHAQEAGAASYWERRAFLNACWAIYRDDARWTPPPYGRLLRELDPRHNDHLARLHATLIHIDALHRTGVRRSRTDQQEIPLTSVLERPLAAATAIVDPRRKDQTAHLALAHLSNDQEAFDRLYYFLIEHLPDFNCRHLIGPVGLSPHLDSGILVDGWGEWPPLHTPGNPPYQPELIERRLRPFQEGRLYQANVPALPAATPGPATIRPLDPSRLAGDLLPLLVAATDNPVAAFPPPDAAEAALILRMLNPAALTGSVAEMDGEVVGFVLLGPDTAGRLRATRGGRPAWRRAMVVAQAALSGRFRVTAGRLFFGAVRPEWRRRGIGAQLWEHALSGARDQGWESLIIGPIWWPKSGEPAAAAFLKGRAAGAPQAYRLYDRSF